MGPKTEPGQAISFAPEFFRTGGSFAFAHNIPIFVIKELFVGTDMRRFSTPGTPHFCGLRRRAVDLNELLSIPQASALLGKTYCSTRDLVLQGRLEGFQHGRSWFVKKDSVEAYLKRLGERD